MLKTRVGVVYGGRSVEHEVSIISALQVFHAIDTEKYEPIPIYISKQGIWYYGDALKELENYRDIPALLSKCDTVLFSPNNGAGKLFFTAPQGMFKKPREEKIDVFFPVMHGAHGEDGCIQGLFELAGIPYVGPGVLGAAVGMDKIMMKSALAHAVLPLVEYDWFYFWEWTEKQEAIIAVLEENIGYPMIVKPSNLGSSIGISKAKSREALLDAVDLAANFSSRIVVERMLEPLREVNCSVLGSTDSAEASVCEEPQAIDEILSFRDKYLSGGKGMSGSTRRIPADLPDELTEKIQKLALRSFRALDGYGVCRIDFLLDSESNIYVNEINTIPGSLSFYLWEPSGKNFAELTDTLIKLALQRSREKEKLTHSYDSNILSSAGLKSGIKK